MADRDRDRDDEAGNGKPRTEREAADDLPLPLDPTYLASLQAELDELRAAMERKDSALREAQTRVRRADEEIGKAKERLQRESERQLDQRLRVVLLGFLDVLDDCERALDAAREVEHNPDVLIGTELVHRRLLGTLERAGVQRQRALGERFDPARFEAMSVAAVEDPDLDGKVVGIAREGYQIRGELLRPAQVIVGKYLPARSTGPLER